MIVRVRALLAKEDPVTAVLYDQKKAMTHALKPTLFMEMANQWPILQRYTRANAQAYKKVAAGVRHRAMHGLGQTPEEDNALFYQIYGYPHVDRTDEKPVVDISGMGFLLDLWDKYGKDAISKNKGEIAKALGLEDKEESPATDAKIQAMMAKAKAEQEAALAKVPNPDPKTDVNPPKYSTGKKAAIGVGIGAAALAFIIAIIWVAKKK
jgi:hypothetical protein